MYNAKMVSSYNQIGMITDGIKLRQLRVFIEVARQNSISRAAKMLSISQPAVTRTIHELETQLGTVLLQRDGRGIKLSPSGEVFLRHAGASVAAVRRGAEAISQGMRSLATPIRVGALPTVSARIMPAAVEKFMNSGTGGRLTITTGNNNTLQFGAGIDPSQVTLGLGSLMLRLDGQGDGARSGEEL